MPVIEELDEDGNVIDEEEGSEEEGAAAAPLDPEAARERRERLARLEAEERERVERQFALGEELRLEGNKLLGENDLEGACQAYEEALKELTMVGNQPDDRARAEKANTALNLNLALANLKLKCYDDAKFRCSTALLVDPKNVKALYRRGLAQAALARDAALFQEAEAKAAIADFEAALDAEPGNAEAQRELAKLRAELRAHERELAQKQRETWGQVFGGRTVVEGEEDQGPPPPPPTVRPCKNGDKHLVASVEGISIEEKGKRILTDLSLELRQSWCIGLTGGEPGAGDALARALRQEARLAAGSVVVHPKEPKPGRRKDPEPIDSSILIGTLVVVLAVLVATELSPASVGLQRWLVRCLAAGMLLMLRAGWNYSQACKAPLALRLALASPAAAAAAAAAAGGQRVEEALGGRLARQLSSEERRERVVAMLAAAGFQGTGEEGVSAAAYVDRGVRLGELPAAQQRVVQLLCCIAERPEVLVCDGALDGLPLDNQARLLRMLKRFKQECKTSVLYLSPDVDEVAYLADSMGVLSPAGELLEKGPTLEVMETPRHEAAQALLAALRERRGGKATGGPLPARIKELLGNKDLDGSWIPPIYT